MSRRPAHIALVITITFTGACASDVTAPTAAPERGPASPLYISRYGYRATVLPFQDAAAINAGGAVVGMLPNGWGAYYAQGVTTVLAMPGDVTVDWVAPVDLLGDGRIIARAYARGRGMLALYYAGTTSGPTTVAVPGRQGVSLYPGAMNSQGVVVGYSDSSGARRAFRWSSGGGFADITPAGQDAATATDIAETGEIIGTVGSGSSKIAYRWDAGGASGMALPSGMWGQQALNGGSVLVRHPVFYQAIWSPTAVRPVGPDPATYSINKIGPSGRLVGGFRDPMGQTFAWTSLGDDAATILPVPAGFSSAWATDVNACGTIIGKGVRASDLTEHAIMWSRYFCDSDSRLPATDLPLFSPA